MKLYIADYHVETTELDVVGHGAYLLLLMAMWRAGGKLPRDEGKLARLAKCTPEQWASVRDDVMAHFKVSGGAIKHSRVAKEIAKYKAVVDGATEAGKASASKKARKNNAQASTNVEETSNEKPTNQNQNSSYVEDKSSTSSDPVSVDDPARTAWHLAEKVLVENGGMTQQAAKAFFGKLLRDNALTAQDLLGSIGGAISAGTRDPKSYLAKAAQGVAKRRAEAAAPPKRVAFV
jgi:uncharacterized protein YdaU (DUF1376 family)